MSAHRIDYPTARAFAVEASCDPRTILKELGSPGSVRGEAGRRVRGVLLAHGLLSTRSDQDAGQAVES